jgi:tRNA pseudouridine32 synthase / 23S rRNA pseudouridine746 synthase
MGRASTASVVTIPAGESLDKTVLDFIAGRFPSVSREKWHERIRDGKILFDGGVAVTEAALCRPQARLHYFREVEAEPVIPFREEILFADDNILVACKPHFLPVHPAGRYVNESLVNRLRVRTGNPDLVPVNRLDRETAGLVLFSARKETRKPYYMMFTRRKVRKAYEALAQVEAMPDCREWTVETKIVKGSPWFVCRNEECGEPNSRSLIRLVDVKDGVGRFDMEPFTGRQHQLRLHMATIGFPVLNDPWYPAVQPEQKKGFDHPLQLLAKKLEFKDPLSGKEMQFESPRVLSTDYRH